MAEQITIDLGQAAIGTTVKITADQLDVNLRTPGTIEATTSVPAQFRPNFLVVLVDDLGPEFFEDYDAENKILGLNRVADGENWSYPDMRTVRAESARGVIFDRAHAMPVCSPSRYALNTGRLPHKTGLGDVIQNDSPGYQEAGSITGTPEVSIAEALKGAGYTTAWVGKGHLAQEIANGGTGPTLITNQLGYDIFRGTVGGLGSDPVLVDADGHAPGWWNYNWYNSPTDATTQVSTQYATTRLRNHTKSAIQTLMPEPFFMLCAAHGVHAPNGGSDLTPKSGSFPAESDAGTDQVTWSGSALYPYTDRMDEWVSHRAAMEALDVVLDSLINGTNGLKELGLYERTFIFIVGDNGSAKSIMEAAEAFGETIAEPYQTMMSSGHLKGSVFGQGSRIPLIVSGPPEIMKGTAGRRSNIRVDIQDIFATILQLAGVKMSDAVGIRPMDSISFAPSLWHEAADANHLRDHNYQEIFGPNGDPANATRHDKRVAMEVSGTNYSYIQNIDSTTEFFFNLDTDPGEVTPLALSGTAYETLKARMAEIIDN